MMRNKFVVLSSDSSPRRAIVRAHEDVISAHVCNTDKNPARSCCGLGVRVECDPSNAHDVRRKARRVRRILDVGTDGREICDVVPRQTRVRRLPQAVTGARTKVDNVVLQKNNMS